MGSRREDDVVHESVAPSKPRVHLAQVNSMGILYWSVLDRAMSVEEIRERSRRIAVTFSIRGGPTEASATAYKSPRFPQR